MKRVATILLFGFATSAANSYELGTHARMTQAAYARSVLATDQTVFEDFGIQPGANPFGEKYDDVSGTTVKERGVFDDFELKQMPSSAKPLSIPGWLMRGAIREDDVPWPFGDNPQDDPYHQPDGFFRVLNHFYDPVNQRPLNLVGFGVGTIAPQWAIGSQDVFSQPNSPAASRWNHFTVFDAREAMYRALTGQSVDGLPVAATKEVRNKYWATTFRALGDVVHLLQDMAQPQHTPYVSFPGRMPPRELRHA